MNKILIKVYAGGGWEGHVVYHISDPTDPSIEDRVSSLEEVNNFCQKYRLSMDEEFLDLVRKYLYFDKKYGVIIPLTEIDENRAITSAGHYLKKYFEKYCY